MFLKRLFYLCLVSIVLGPLGQIPLGLPQINLYVTDVIVGLFCIIRLVKFKQLVKVIETDQIAKYFCGFVVISILSLLFSPINLKISEKFISALYIVRLVSYFFVYLTARFLIREKLVSFALVVKLLIFTGFALAGLGWIQYFLYPDLRNLFYLGWDPHLYRIFSTYLDPNYFGLMMVLTLVVIMTQKVKYQYILSSYMFLTLMFTYSRSSFLAFLGALIFFILSKKKLKLAGIVIFALLIFILILPKPGGVGVQLGRIFSVETRIENWKVAYKIFTGHPFLGVGYNTVRYAKQQYNFTQDNILENHAGAGFDNSILFIAATTGLFGLVPYFLFLRNVFQKGSFMVKLSFISVVIHSFFLNTLFFPWVMVWMWVVTAISSYHSEA